MRAHTLFNHQLYPNENTWQTQCEKNERTQINYNINGIVNVACAVYFKNVMILKN